MSSTGLFLPTELSLIGRTALVTGSSRGIGRGIALLLAERGASVIVHHVSTTSSAAAEGVAAAIRALPGLESGARRACVVRADLADPSAPKRIVEEGLAGVGSATLDILVNNAVQAGDPSSAAAPDLAGFDAMMNVGVKAPMLLVKEMLAVLPERGGRIINISSIASQLNISGRAEYAMCKAALETLTRQHAAELARAHRLTANAVRVGTTDTQDEAWRAAQAAGEGGEGMTPQRRAHIARVLDMITAEARRGSVDDVAQAVAWLASDSARWVNGEVLNANGGTVFN